MAAAAPSRYNRSHPAASHLVLLEMLLDRPGRFVGQKLRFLGRIARCLDRERCVLLAPPGCRRGVDQAAGILADISLAIDMFVMRPGLLVTVIGYIEREGDTASDDHRFAVIMSWVEHGIDWMDYEATLRQLLAPS